MNNNATTQGTAFKVRYMVRGIACDYSAAGAPPCSLATAIGLVRALKRRGYTAWIVDAITGNFRPVRGVMRNPDR